MDFLEEFSKEAAAGARERLTKYFFVKIHASDKTPNEVIRNLGSSCSIPVANSRKKNCRRNSPMRI